MRALTRRFVPLLLVALVGLLSLHAPAEAKSRLLHAKFSRALSAARLDSTAWLMSTTSLDTLEFFGTDVIDPTSVSVLDTNTTASLAAVSHIPLGGTAIVVEVTGSLQSADSVYVGLQLSQGPTALTDGTSGNPVGNQSDAYNWRWYNALLPSAGGVVVNSSGSQTFVFPVPCAGPNAFIWANDGRVIIQGDTNASAKGFGTRVWLVTRDRP